MQLVIWFAGVVSLAVAGLLLCLSASDSSCQTVRVWFGILFLVLTRTLMWLGVRAGKPWQLSTSESRNTFTGFYRTFYRQLGA